MRHNIFTDVHTPVKLALLSTCISVSNKKHWNIKKAEKNLEKVSDAINTFIKQISFEENVILPMMFEFEPAIWNKVNAEHQQLVNSAKTLQHLIQSLLFEGSEVVKFSIMMEINDLYNRFVMDNYNHMDDEEEVINNILWQYFDDNVLQSLQYTNNNSRIVTSSKNPLYKAA